MTETLLILVMGVAFVVVLLVALLHRKQQPTVFPVEGEGSGDSRAVLTALELTLPSRLLSDRILSEKDWEFVRRESPSLEQVFHQERKTIALLWLKDARTCVARLFRFYRMAVRSSAALQFWTELRIATNYCLFLLLVTVVQSLIYLRGPFYARGMIMRIFATTDRVSTAVGRTLAALDPSSVARIKDNWARQGTPSD